ncbi:NAD(P)H oxidoreductase [Alteribacillus bidgolensis]|uniref:Putative NADPH-quinone reductase (Modulator of drug activity B) n=1 Tax=Alteribacillus bidgolensis TaxID=930129 RepID=A0A1G8RRL2_9BACI|nr:NAD(P)H oxidoreductase [Alteribacillus bidgolensis]SDJ19549.1 Putative NADPH-quinone reductase (modulator of drug activity B) [Alteribacillus bidgolensis]
MKILTVVTHPRENSLTFKVADHFVQGLKDAGHETEILDLYRSGFNPVLWEEDEPEWSADHQEYSPEVEMEMERMKRHDSLAFVFPLWWWSMPAMLKGYIDRVWNWGFAYGPGKLDHEKVLWLSLAGAPIERFEKRQYDNMMTRYFNVGLADYCGIQNSQFELFYETINVQPGYMEEWLTRAYNLGLHYAKY